MLIKRYHYRRYCVSSYVVARVVKSRGYEGVIHFVEAQLSTDTEALRSSQ